MLYIIQQFFLLFSQKKLVITKVNFDANAKLDLVLKIEETKKNKHGEEIYFFLDGDNKSW